MAWTAERSTLGQFCPVFDGEMPAGIARHESDFLKMNSGVRVEGRHLPIRFTQKSKHKKLPDVLQLSETWLVSEKLRSLIEKLEPNIHQFFQIPIFLEDGSPAPTIYSAFNICQSIDAIAYDRSKITWFTRDDGSKYCTGGGSDDGLVVNKKQIMGKHVWRERQYLTHLRFFSDDLKNMLEEARIQRLRFLHVVEHAG